MKDKRKREGTKDPLPKKRAAYYGEGEIKRPELSARG